jgi:hypothetical protein
MKNIVEIMKDERRTINNARNNWEKKRITDANQCKSDTLIKLKSWAKEDIIVSIGLLEWYLFLMVVHDSQISSSKDFPRKKFLCQ